MTITELRNAQQATTRFINLYGGVRGDNTSQHTHTDYLRDLTTWAGLTPYQRRVIDQRGMLMRDEDQVYLLLPEDYTQAEHNVFYLVRDQICNN